MTIRIDRNRNTTDEAILSDAIVVGVAATVTILPANADRIYVAIFTDKFDIWLKFQDASVDNDLKGIFLRRGQTYEFPPDTLYTGEISAIATPNSSDVYTTELV